MASEKVCTVGESLISNQKKLFCKGSAIAENYHIISSPYENAGQPGASPYLFVRDRSISEEDGYGKLGSKPQMTFYV